MGGEKGERREGEGGGEKGGDGRARPGRVRDSRLERAAWKAVLREPSET